MKALFSSVLLASTLAVSAASAEPGAWDRGRIRHDLEAGRPLVVHVTVALCDNAQIDCGSAIAGRPGDLFHNVYWGAIFGARRFLERKDSSFERLALYPAAPHVLERVVYRRRVPATRWKLRRKGDVVELVVLDAIDGRSIDRATTGFFRAATGGESLEVELGGETKKLAVHVSGYVGHNRLLDGLALPRVDDDAKIATPSFVLACYSERYFGESLRRAGSEPLVTTRQLMAPEGYVLRAVLEGIGDGASKKQIRARTVDAYAKWQHLSHGAASWIFASE